MNKTAKFEWFVIFLSCMCNFKSGFSEEPIPVHFKGKYTSDIKNYEIVFPQRVNEDGSFISHLVSHQHSKRSTKEVDFIFYKIPIGGKDYLIELTPNRKLISPGAVVEIHREGVRKSDNEKFSNQSTSNEKFTKMFRNLDIRKLENTDCHFSGHVKGENTSKAALSTCNGLAGFIQIHKGFYTIEPVAEHNPFLEGAYPHILYKSDGLDNSSVCHTMGEFASSVVDKIVRKRRECNAGSNSPLFIETLIVMDKTFINYYEDSDCENYVLTVFNMAFNLFRDASSGLMMTLTLVRLIRLEIENDEMNLKVNADAEESLRHFQTWQYQINPGDDSHPNHHDIALLVTKVDVCYSPSACGLLGLTTIGKGCDPILSAALCEDTGLRLGYVIAHEIGHLLGADHDNINSTCNGTDAEGLRTVMHPHISTTTQTWSSCSQAYFKEFFSSGKGCCFFDEPEEHHFNVHDLLPGVMYNADFQCKFLITINARECDMGSTCDSLNCHVPGYACIITHDPPVDGTCCGENMWCRENKCLVIGERPGAVDGNWGDWSAWSDCSRTCGSGVASSTRNCDKPRPSRGGKNCVGERKRYKVCAATVISCFSNALNLKCFYQNLYKRNYFELDGKDLIRFISEEVNVSFVGKPCETGRPSFRDIQCGEFDDWIYPEDGETHLWKSYFFHDDNPCVLYCINEKKQVAALRPRVVDGTMCYRGIRDICISGLCKSLPCDLHFGSNAVEDACGVCHGDGTNCEFSEGKESFSKLSKGLTKLINVPSGSRNIKVEEILPTLSKIVVRDKDTKEVYVRGKSLGMYSVPGSQAWLGMIKKNQEALHIPGPITKPLSIWIQRLENVTVKWSMALPAEQQRKPEFAWDFLKWGPCSAFCGPGTQKSEPSCTEEKAGMVEDSFCADLEMPAAKVRTCEVTKCQSRWMVGDWKNCDPEKKERKRVVYCIKQIGENEGESQIVSDSECNNPKPHDSEPCENRQKREDTEYYYNEFFPESDSVQFKPDNSEYGFHKKYDVYLKHFPALSVPQRNSETIPVHLVSSPHFKHYFHVLETPDSDSAGCDSIISSDENVQNKVSPEFVSETFSGQQVSITHVQSALPDKSNPSERRWKKNLNFKFKSKGFPKLKERLEKRSKMLENVEYLKRPFDPRRRIHIKNSENKPSQKLHSKRKNFNYSLQNLSNFFQNLQKNNKTHFIPHHNRGSHLPFLELNKLKDYEWDRPKHNPKSFSQNFNHFLSFFTKNCTSSKHHYETLNSDQLQTVVKPNRKDFDGSGLRKILLTDENVKNINVEDFMKKGKGCNFLQTAGLGVPSKKALESRRLATEDLFQDKKFKKYHRKKKFFKQKRTTNFHKKYKRRLMNKHKRSNRKWKKPKLKESNPKLGKELVGTCAGTETKNYLNNLFRDNHPKPIQQPHNAESNVSSKRPIIKEGIVVIDQDLPQDKKFEIAFEDEFEQKLEKYSELPQPEPNGEKLTITGQDVFKLLHELHTRSFHDITKSPSKTGKKGVLPKPGDKNEISNETTDKIEAIIPNSKTIDKTATITPSIIQITTDKKTFISSDSSTKVPQPTEDFDEYDYDFSEAVLDYDPTEYKKKSKKKKKKSKDVKKETES